jgi:hypothetical protein
MYSALDCFQKEEMRTAGGAGYAGELRPWTGCSIPCGLIQRENIRGGAKERGGDRGEEVARGSLARSESTGDVCR